MSILIKNAMIVTMDESKDVIDKGYVLIEEDEIKEIQKGEYTKSTENMEVIDGNGYCVLPGLINCHTHAAMTLLRGYGEGLPLMRWLNEKIWPAESKFKEEHIILGTKLACLEMLRSGTTTFNDMYFMLKEVADTIQEMNIRAVLGLCIIGDHWKEDIMKTIELNNIVSEKKTPLIRTMFAPHSPYTLSKEALEAVAELAYESKKPVHIHISETNDEINIIKEKYGKTPVEFLEELGLFKNHVAAAHCVHLTDSDMDIMKKYDVSPIYNPQSNMKLASGMSRIAEMLNKDINVCIGTDGTSSNNNLNMFEEMQTGALLQKLKYSDATLMDGKTMLKMATVNGAKALGFKKLGVLKEGYSADLIMVNLNRPNMVPVHDIYSNLVFSANSSEVDYVIVNGKLVMKKGEFLFIDEEKILYESNEICKTFI